MLFILIVVENKNIFLNLRCTKKGYLFQEMFNNKRSFLNIKSYIVTSFMFVYEEVNFVTNKICIYCGYNDMSIIKL